MTDLSRLTCLSLATLSACGILWAMVMAGGTAAQAVPLQLATNGTTKYSIVVDPQATAAEKHAADELASFLKQVTGAAFPIRLATSAGDTPSLIVGPGAAARALAPKLRFDNLQPDGIVIESVGTNLILAGDRPRGTLYAVYSFLEDTVGCHWWTSKASTVPHRPTLSVPAQHVRYIPPLEYREPFWYDAFNPDWAVRNKYNGNRVALDAAHGGHISYGSWFVHTFNSLVPPKQYFAQHPEWFSEINGKRVGGNGERVQLCLTNKELQDFVAQRVLDWLAKHPDCNIVSISQNDWDGHCQCPKCQALEKAEGSPAGPLLHFVNAIAARVAEKYPNVAIDTLAYQYTRKPPRHVKPLPNVIVRLCSIECNFLRPLTDPSNAKFAQDIKGWSKICQRLYIWDYVTNFHDYIMPHPNLRVLAPNIRFFVANGVKGVFEEGAYQSPGAALAELQAWVEAKLLWQPNLDPQALIDEFVKGYYGPAAPYISQYINLLEDSAEATNYYLSIGSSPTAPFFNLTFMGQAEKLFDEAEAAVKTDPDLLARVQVAHLPIRYLWAIRWQDFQAQARKQGVPWPGPADYLSNAKTFMDVAHANHITMLSEGCKIGTFEARTIGLARKASPPPPGCEKLADDDYVDLQDAGFNLAHEGTWAALAHDDLASDGVAARMPGNHYEWAVQQRLGVAGLDPNATYTVYASIRFENTVDEGEAFSYGLYDVLNKRGVTQQQVACKDLHDGKYHTYKVATGKLNGQMYLWVAPPKNPDNVKAVWVDRFWLVKQK